MIAKQSHHASQFSPRVLHGLILLLFASVLMVIAPVYATDYPWTVAIYGEDSIPTGWVQVRENAVDGTKLNVDRNLNVNYMQTIRLLAWKPLSDVSEMHFGFSTSQLNGHAMTSVPVYYNGTTIAPGRIDTVTGFQDFFAFDASYWYRLFDFGNGGRLWGSVGATYVMLNFTLNGTIAANSVGHELREDFYVQELPVPILGLHLRYPLTDALTVTADVSAGRLPWVNSLRTEGGEIRLAQTDDEAMLGFEYRFAAHWQAVLYGFHRYFGQNERSREDGNVIRLRTNGVGLGVNYQF
ncbi:hypothetical protein [Dyella lipolytica]|uniref:Outer membrane protein beta-barrel domain-containing protein n=1 Tax=Dyella lipolytica TaxID=1867835 RepID=A0ABW8IS77_9GAMM|nr:hypothetical protein [Dyella lipolytica]